MINLYLFRLFWFFFVLNDRKEYKNDSRKARTFDMGKRNKSSKESSG